MNRTRLRYLAGIALLALGMAGTLWNSARAAGRGGVGPGGVVGGTGTIASPPAARPAAASAPALSAAELYKQIVSKYLASEWDTLPTDLAKTKDITAMTKDQQADVAYIRQAIADGRPTWWNDVKQGKKLAIPTKIWQKTVNIISDPALAPGTVNMQQNGAGQMAFTLGMPAADMDNPAIAEHGFTKGDLAYCGIWGAMETCQLYSSLSLQKLSSLSPAENAKLGRFLMLRGALAAGYYGTPAARRWSAFLSCDAYVASHQALDGFIPRRPLAVLLEEEIVSHPTRYPSIKLPRNLKADTVEASLATNFMGQFEKQLTFAEDKALREAIKDFALTNTTVIYESGKVTLPSKLTIALDPNEDGDNATKRAQWLMDEIAHPGVHAEAATKPATTSKPAPTSKPASTSKPAATMAAVTSTQPTNIRIDKTYDRFEDKTSVSLFLEKATIKQPDFPVSTMVFSFTFAGEKLAVQPKEGMFLAVASHAPLSVIFLADGKPVKLDSLKDSNVSGSEWYFQIMTSDLKILASAKKLEVRVGTVEMVLSDEDRQAINDLLAAITPK